MFIGDEQDLNGLVIVIFSSASYLNQSDLHSAIATFRQISECESEIIVSRVQEPQLESNLVITTLLIVGYGQWEVNFSTYLCTQWFMYARYYSFIRFMPLILKFVLVVLY